MTPKAKNLKQPLVLAFTLALATLAVTATPAFAGTHGLTAIFGTAGSGNDQFNEPSGIAVNNATDDVYVVDKGNNRVEKFGPNGEFILMFGKSVNKTQVDGGIATKEQEDVCTALSGNECQPGTKASTPGAFENAQFVAVEPVVPHDVYVGDTGDNLVSKFTPEGELVATWGNNGTAGAANGQLNGSASPEKSFGEIAGIAVGTTGTLYVLNKAAVTFVIGGHVFEFDPDSTFVSEVELKTEYEEVAPLGLGVNAVGDIFRNGADAIFEFQPAGSQISVLTPQVAGPFTVDQASGDVYFAGQDGTLDHLAFNGAGEVIEPGGGACKEKCAPTDSVPVGFAGTGIAVASATGTVYVADAALDRVDVFAESSGLKNKSPLTISEGSSGVKAFTATVETLLNPDEHTTYCEVEYATEKSLLEEEKGTFVPCNPEIFSGFEGYFASKRLEGLDAGMTYYYRIVQTEIDGETGKGEGPIQSFETPGLPRPSTGEAQDITRVTSLLSGSVDPERVAGSYHFVYIEKGAYDKALAEGAENPFAEGASTATHELPAGDASEATEPLVANGLLPGTTYYYALVASNEVGVNTGEAKTFTTAAATPPLATTGAASGVTMSTATISGSVGTQGLDVSYAFEVSTEPGNPGPPSGGGSIGAGPTEASVSVALQGLQPGTTYYYRILATSTDGTSYGEIKTFTTPGFTPPLTLPATPPLLATPSIAFPTGGQENTGKPETKQLTNAQRLANALKQCKKDKHKSNRTSCEKAAHKKYRPAKKKEK
jgi:DNA-binding beta-propeller fold protein YncE